MVPGEASKQREAIPCACAWGYSDPGFFNGESMVVVESPKISSIEVGSHLTRVRPHWGTSLHRWGSITGAVIGEDEGWG